MKRKFALMVIAPACMVSMLLALGLAIHAQAKQSVDWLILSTEIFTPALIIASALMVYFGRRSRPG